ncbi:hypothetical protein F900_01041 [Acinetobacter modestus]|uniref:DUF4238 domain-containing protein n=1 Tax=Acinetobacter modestus TaxID=1776740 RepID=N9NKT7_9GAMM|nr:DUF4238 domain-containing protein [Acinetobacter modestus]ENX02595.1 hypothetical protein F900_01041 [Acinetobacter modestus]
MSQKSSNHHYVPRGLLKNWYIKNSDHKNQGFWKYQRRNGEVSLFPNPSSTKSSCSEKHLNTTYQNIFSIAQEVIEDSDSIEDELAKLDTSALEIINEKLVSKEYIESSENSDQSSIRFGILEIDSELTEQEKKILAKFILSLHFRHPETLELAKEMLEKEAQPTLDFLQKKLEKYGIGDHLDFYKKNTNLFTMLKTLNSPENFQHIYNMDWRIAVFNNDFLISGEKPLVINFLKNEIKPDLGFTLSLSPNVLLIGNHSLLLKDDLESLQKFINDFILDYNSIVCEQSRYAISSHELNKDLADIYLSALK